jgi:hypothetical protein
MINVRFFSNLKAGSRKKLSTLFFREHMQDRTKGSPDYCSCIQIREMMKKEAVVVEVLAFRQTECDVT